MNIKNLSNDYEWICTNGIGGYALGSRDLINKRKYHGLLIASYDNLKRIHLVSSIEEKFIFNDKTVFIDSNNYYDTVYPTGYKRILKSWVRPYPSFLYNLADDTNDMIFLLKEIFMPKDSNTVLIRYTNLSGRKIEYRLRPKFTMRDHHWVNKPGTYDTVQTYIESSSQNGCCFGYVKRNDFNFKGVYFYSNMGDILKDSLIFRNVYYSKEAKRGYDAFEDFISPFLLQGVMNQGEALNVIFSDEAISEKLENICDSTSFNNLKDKIIGRYKKLPLPKDHPRYGRDSYFIRHGVIDIDANKYFSRSKMSDTINDALKENFNGNDYKKILGFMLEDFRINDDIIAGYPWFSAWGRDTMISLEAFMLEFQNRLPFIFSVLELYGSKMKNGIMPNVKGEGGEGENYDTVDASLWYLQRIHDIFDFLGYDQKDKLLKYVGEIICNYLYNEQLPFYCDENDRLICIRKSNDRALTWMDAKVDGKAVTPRYGKPIEINGLWYSGLKATVEMAIKLGKEIIYGGRYEISIRELKYISEIVKYHMKKYFIDDMWLDLIDGDEKEAKQIRPNFVIALSLPFDFADYQSTFKGYKIAKEKLLTQFGLRSLSMDSVNFIEEYSGDQRSRDLAYHQGTVWTWLLMPYAKLIRKIKRDNNALKEELTSIISKFRDMIKSGTIASIAEVWDGKNPSIPKGAPAQAWSVAAVYYIEKLIDSL